MGLQNYNCTLSYRKDRQNTIQICLLKNLHFLTAVNCSNFSRITNGEETLHRNKLVFCESGDETMKLENKEGKLVCLKPRVILSE